MECIVIPDTAVAAVNCGRKENVSSSIVYRDKKGRLHSVDFEICSLNFKAEHEGSSDNCIGERDVLEGYFTFYTSGIKTKVQFKKIYVRNLLGNYLFKGTKEARFRTLHNLICETGYTTYDLS